MKVFKFGGASIKDAKAVRNMANIVRSFLDDELVIVVSAMGKTTNALENILEAYRSKTDFRKQLENLREYHFAIATDLLDKNSTVFVALSNFIEEIEHNLENGDNPEMTYDQVVAVGEMMSSSIVAEFLNTAQLNVHLIDARQVIRTDSTFREGKVDWERTKEAINAIWEKKPSSIILTQGFIGGDSGGMTTTLGREGSDFTAAIFGSCLRAESVTIWKDVPGVMTADPKRIPEAVVFDELPYKEAAEMTYYGASVIHPKTIKPLALNQIPLLVKSFDDPSLRGTKIHDCKVSGLPPLIIFKENQCLISCKVTDYTFVNEQQLSLIFSTLSELNMRINVMQNSAISFSFCIDYREWKISLLVDRLKDSFEVFYNTGLTLITVKNYDENTFEKYRKFSGVILEQFSRSTLQVLVRQ